MQKRQKAHTGNMAPVLAHGGAGCKQQWIARRGYLLVESRLVISTIWVSHQLYLDVFRGGFAAKLQGNKEMRAIKQCILLVLIFICAMYLHPPMLAKQARTEHLRSEL